MKGKWHYLYRAINKQGETLDFYFSYKRNKEATYQFLRRCLRYYDVDNQPKTLNTDKHSSYANAIARLKKGFCAHFSEKSNVRLQPFIYKG
ncbi:hypothetical protein VCHA29O37_730002 [Vibrio chagasii]|nr:hypothetical protein VCHA29O37_730002 [Vibrio chagasii]